MTVIVVQRVPPGLRGRLSKWMTEVGTGVFVAKLSARVRQRVWEACRREVEDAGGSALAVWRTPTPQGFEVDACNARGRFADAVDGVWLVRTGGGLDYDPLQLAADALSDPDA